MKFANFCLTLFIAFSINYSSAQSNFDLLVTALENDKISTPVIDRILSIKNMESINTPHLDYCPVMHNDGIVFSSNRPRKKNFINRFFSTLNSNLYYTAQEGEDFFYTPIELPGKVNTSKHEGSSTFDATGNKMVYTCNCNQKNIAGMYDLKLCSANFEGGKWLPGNDIPFGEDYRSCHPTFSVDGTTMVFASQRPDSHGGMDLYVSTFLHGEWQHPQNLGPEINSSKDEVFPTLTDDGILVYSSNGLKGKGGLDLFYAKPIEAYSWGEAQNFGPCFNSVKDDFGFLSFGDGLSGLFTSNRGGGLGEDDIYMWKLDMETIPEEAQMLSANLLILDQFTGIPLNESAITLIEINNKLLQTNQLTDEITISNKVDRSLIDLLGARLTPYESDIKGHQYNIQMNKDYFLLIEQEGYTPIQKIVGYEHLIKQEDYVVVMNPDYNHALDNLVMTEDNPIEEIIPPVEEVEAPVIAGMVIIDTDTVQSTEITLPNEVVNLDTEAVAVEESTVTPSEAIEPSEPLEEVFTSRGIPADMIKGAEAVSTKASPKVEAIIKLDNIYYEFNKYELTSDSKIAIDEIVEIMAKDLTMKITVQSHTDSRGKKSFNKWLSQQRADAVKAYMVSMGIEKFRITAEGMGEELLLNDCRDDNPCDEENHKKNRRTEFIIDQRTYLMTE